MLRIVRKVSEFAVAPLHGFALKGNLLGLFNRRLGGLSAAFAKLTETRVVVGFLVLAF